MPSAVGCVPAFCMTAAAAAAAALAAAAAVASWLRPGPGGPAPKPAHGPKHPLRRTERWQGLCSVHISTELLAPSQLLKHCLRPAAAHTPLQLAGHRTGRHGRRQHHAAAERRHDGGRGGGRRGRRGRMLHVLLRRGVGRRAHQRLHRRRQHQRQHRQRQALRPAASNGVSAYRARPSMCTRFLTLIYGNNKHVGRQRGLTAVSKRLPAKRGGVYFPHKLVTRWESPAQQGLLGNKGLQQQHSKAIHEQGKKRSCPLLGAGPGCRRAWLPWPPAVSGSCCPAYCMGRYAGTNSAMDVAGAHCGR